MRTSLWLDAAPWAMDAVCVMVKRASLSVG